MYCGIGALAKLPTQIFAMKDDVLAIEQVFFVMTILLDVVGQGRGTFSI